MPRSMIDWELLHPHFHPADLGLIPGMLDDEDPRSAREQFDANYQHGGGWLPMEGMTLGEGLVMRYPGDPPYYPLAQAWLRDELIVFYPFAFVAIIQADHSFEVCRLD